MKRLGYDKLEKDEARLLQFVPDISTSNSVGQFKQNPTETSLESPSEFWPDSKNLPSPTLRSTNDAKEAQNFTDSGERGEFNSRTLRLILQKTKIYDLFEKYVSDPRRVSSITYSVPSILMHALSLMLLHQKSRNALHDKELLSSHLKSNLAKLIQAPSTPSPKTVEDLMLNLNANELEPILPALFHMLLRKKFFQLHPEYRMDIEGNEPASFLLGIDAKYTHTYYDSSQHPAASCPYCLKRTRGEVSWYLHCDVSLCVIGKNGFVFPLFLYRVKANHAWEGENDEILKQECELSALPHLLEKFRKYFPKLKATLLLDSLYAQGTTMDLCDQFKLGYMITRKSGSLQSLNDNIEGLKKLQSPETRQYQERRWNKEQTAYIFSDLSHQGHNFTLIDLNEKWTKRPSKRFAKVCEKSSHWQWIVNQSVRVDLIFQTIYQARLRWSQENFFNALVNRGFNLGHDFSRSPHSHTIWHLLMFIAFALSTLMQLSSLGYLSRKGCAVVNWIEIIFSELCSLPTDLLWRGPIPKQLRFWFDTS